MEKGYAMSHNPFHVGEIIYRHDMVRYKPGWYYYDEDGVWYGPYRSEMDALQRLLKHCATRNGMPNAWERFWQRVRGFVRGHA
jgi:hypothetical protein